MSSQPQPSHKPSETWIARLVSKPVFWVATVLFLFSWPIARVVFIDLPASLPVGTEVRGFRLVNHWDAPYGSADLQTRVWVASVVCTRCPDVNPQIMDQLVAIQHRSRAMGDAFRLVSFSVSPQNDTPEELAKLAVSHRASSRRWVFLTGESATLASVLQDIWGADAKRGSDSPMVSKLAPLRPHRVALIDRRMRIRGHYDLREDEALDQLMIDMGNVANLPE